MSNLALGDLFFLFYSCTLGVLVLSVDFESKYGESPKVNPKYAKFGSYVFINFLFNFAICSFYFGERAGLLSGVSSLSAIGFMKGKLARTSSCLCYLLRYL